MRAVFVSVCTDFESELVEFDGEDDHVHLLVNYPLKIAVSTFVDSPKGVSSRMVRQKKYPSIQRKLWVMGRCSMVAVLLYRIVGGAPIQIARQYIEQQQTPH